MSVRECLDNLENLVVGARRVPFTDKTLVNDSELIHYVDELRNDLPNELNRAEEIMANRDHLIETAKDDAARIRKEANDYAKQVTDEQEIIKNSKAEAERIQKEAEEAARALYEKAQAEAASMVEAAQAQAKETREAAQRDATEMKESVDAYATQVFDQLISCVSTSFKGVRQAETGLSQALSVLKEAKAQMNAQR